MVSQKLLRTSRARFIHCLVEPLFSLSILDWGRSAVSRLTPVPSKGHDARAASNLPQKYAFLCHAEHVVGDQGTGKRREWKQMC